MLFRCDLLILFIYALIILWGGVNFYNRMMDNGIFENIVSFKRVDDLAILVRNRIAGIVALDIEVYLPSVWWALKTFKSLPMNA